jgi:hypothetical protein
MIQKHIPYQLMAPLALLLAIGSSPAVADGSFTFVKDDDAGTLTLKEGSRKVFSFVYRPRLQPGVSAEYRRAGYMHPLYDLSGEPLTQDFPKDHYHHRGIWLSWPWMKYEGKKIQLWHPSPLRQQFDRWIERKAEADRAVLALRNDWVLDGQTIGWERWRIVAHKAAQGHRSVDLTLTFAATEKPIQLRGKQIARKGYGGLTVRTAQPLAKGRLLTSEGSLEGDAVQKRFKWADLSTPQRGLAVFAHPTNANHPPPWLLRNSYGGVLNPEWPGLSTVTLEPGEPVTLRYRLYVHQGQPDAAALREAYRRWLQNGDD